MTPLCNNCEEFVEILNSYQNMNKYYFKRNLERGFMVTSKVRKQFLTSEFQGKYIIKGSVRNISFENLGGGVYKVHIEKVYNDE